MLFQRSEPAASHLYPSQLLLSPSHLLLIVPDPDVLWNSSTAVLSLLILLLLQLPPPLLLPLPLLSEAIALLPFHCHHPLFMLSVQPAILMMKIKSRQEKTPQEKLYIVPNAATPGAQHRRCLLSCLENDLNSLLI
jgi:hypothetical protein